MFFSRCTLFFSVHILFRGVAFADSSASSGHQNECVSSNSVDYRGEQRSSSSGLTCLIWTNATRDYDVTSHPDSETGVGDHSYCRNPDSSDKLWCYVVDTDGTIRRQFCAVDLCKEQPPTVEVAADSLSPTVMVSLGTLEPAKSGASVEKAAVVQPVLGISQRVHTPPKRKKDLGIVGYVIGSFMIAVIIILGVGITIGYFYKRGRDLKSSMSRWCMSGEMQRITLPMSAFSNPTCELVDENTIVITAEEEASPVQEGAEGADPLMGQQAGTPGA
ncbi:phosphoinositide-3-kinase-interacting protein 1 isoform X2 [Thalassophryne amazonica]|uniref:phosphoinositide-3-kinase-interacting protein 1 isoform X2 n=1 Tax=Thalassophryne amazonica TaxID=390379 RepID=UPI001471E81D|nr:phosphoinositide-3-kinase-interacting protein 1 isoform X2 [Thalassophryne amazonica]